MKTKEKRELLTILENPKKWNEEIEKRFQKLLKKLKGGNKK